MTARSVRRLKPLIYPILFFFCWTNLGIYNIAYAATVGAYGDTPLQMKDQSPEEKFQESLERLRDAVDREDHQKIKTERTELEKQDVEIKKQFKETEDKIKGLPEAIKQRHRDFVKKYEENLNTLKGHINGIEKAKTKADVKVNIEKAKTFLEKTKPPKRHVPLDPNKLPHRTVEPKFKEPRLKKEEFEKSSGQGSVASGQQTIGNVGWATPTEKLLGFNRPLTTDHRPLVQLASNGPLTGLVSELPSAFSDSPIHPFTDSPLILALNTTDLPTSSDLSQTIEVQFTPDIQAKAAELNYNPVKIYEWVRNNIEYVPTYGSIQGADMCLQTKQCNDMDTASLLIALLRASNISARYVYGTIELPIDKVMNWVGGFTNEQAAVNFIASGGVPIKAYTSGGKIAKVQMEHVWVEAWIDYIPSRGAVHKQGDTWIPLDASYKQYTYKTGLDVQQIAGFDSSALINQITLKATIDSTTGSITNVPAGDIQAQFDSARNTLKDHLNNLPADATVGDVIGSKDIIRQSYSILPASLPNRVIVKGSKFVEIPQNYRHTITFSMGSDVFDYEFGVPLIITKSLPEIAGKKITLSYRPATAKDEATINSYLPAPHADGTPIQPSELPSSLPAYLINLKPELRIDGQVVATGMLITMGSEQTFTMSLNEPGYGISNIDNIITAGEYCGIGLDTGRIGVGQLNALKTKLAATKAKLETQNYTGLSKDDLMGDLLYATIASYFAELDMSDGITARTMAVVRCRVSSIGMFSMSLDVKEVFGVPVSAGAKGMMMDVDHIMQVVFAKDGNMDKVRQFMQASGNISSLLEHGIPERLLSTSTNQAQGLSAVKALYIANDQGIPIYTVNQANLNIFLPQLQVDDAVKADILNAVNAGKVVTVSKTNVNFNNWIGCGYIITNPLTGAGAYMISAGTNGSFTFWAYTDQLGLLCSLSNWPLSNVTEIAPFINGFYNSFSYLLVAFSCVIDIYNAFSDPNLTVDQRAAILSLVIGLTILASLAVFLSVPTLWVIVINVAIAVWLNFIKFMIMDYIMNAASIRNRFIVRACLDRKQDLKSNLL